MKLDILILIITTLSVHASECPNLDGKFKCPVGPYSNGKVFSLKSHSDGYTFTSNGFTERWKFTGIRMDAGEGHFESEFCENSSWVLIIEYPNGKIDRVERFITNGQMTHRISSFHAIDYITSTIQTPEVQELLCESIEE